MMDALDVEFIVYATLLVIFFDNHRKSRLMSLAPMANKKANKKTETSMKDATSFNSETYKTYFITIMKDIYEIDLIT